MALYLPKTAANPIVVAKPRDIGPDNYFREYTEVGYRCMFMIDVPILGPNNEAHVKNGDKFTITVPESDPDYPWAVPFKVDVADGFGNTRTLEGKAKYGISEGGINPTPNPYTVVYLTGTTIKYGPTNVSNNNNFKLGSYIEIDNDTRPIVGAQPNKAIRADEINMATIFRFDEPGIFAYSGHNVNFQGQENDFHGSVRVIKPVLLIDENNNDDVSDENQDRQFKYGAIVPINDGFALGQKDGDHWLPDFTQTTTAENDMGLRLVRFESEDSPLTTPQYNPQEKGNGALKAVMVRFSSNLRLWKSRQKSPENLIRTVDVHNHVTYLKTWDLTNQADYDDLLAMNGQFYVECLPDPLEPYSEYPHSEHRWIDISYTAVGPGPADMSTAPYRIYIQSISDKNEGFRNGEPAVAAGGPMSIDLTSGALKGSWPIAQSGSAIIPDIALYYNSRDNAGGEMNPRLGPAHERFILSSNGGDSRVPYPSQDDPTLSEVGHHFWLSTEMRLVRGADCLILLEGDGTRVCFRPKNPIPDGGDESGVIWIPAALNDGGVANPKAEFSTIVTKTRTQFEVTRDCYVLVRPSENKQYVFERATGKLAEIRDVYNNFAKFEYEEYGGTRGHLKRISDNRGIAVQFQSGGNGTVTVTNGMGRPAVISKTGVQGPLGNYTFTLNQNDRITQYSNALTGSFTVNSSGGGSLDNSETVDVMPDDLIAHPNQVLSQTFGIVYGLHRSDGANMIVDNQFDSDSAVVQHYVIGDENPRVSAIQFNRNYDYWTSMTVPGSSTVLVQTALPDTRLINSRTNILNGESTFEYDTNLGLVTVSHDPDKNIGSFVRTYTSESNSRFNANGPNYVESVVELIATTDGKGQQTNYGFVDGFTVDITDSMDGAVSIDWDDALPKTYHGPRSGYTRELTYDGSGRVISSAETAESVTRTTNYTLDPLGRTLQADLPDGRKMIYRFDTMSHAFGTDGPLVTNEEKLNGIRDGGTTRTAYDFEGNLLFSKDQDGRSVTRTFNELGALLSINNSDSGTTAFSIFTGLLLPGKTTLPPIGSGGSVREITHEYDDGGREISRLLPGNRNVSFAYDDSARTVLYTDPRGFSTTQLMTAAGRTDKTTGPLGYQVKQGYDQNGMPNFSKRNGLTEQICEYNQRMGPVDSGIKGILMTHNDYDEGTAVSSSTYPGSITVETPRDNLARLIHSKIGELITGYGYQTSEPVTMVKTITSPGGATTTVDAWDANYLFAHWHTDINTFNYSVNTADGTRIASPVQQTIPGSATNMPSGRPGIVTDGRNKQIVNQFDFALRLQGTKDQDGIGATTSFHPSAYVSKTTDERGKDTTYFYEEDTGFLKAVRYPDDKGVVYTDFDENGNPGAATFYNTVNANGVGFGTSRSYFYQYDDLNRKTHTTDEGGKTTVTKYTIAGQIDTVTDPAGRTTKYTYDGAGRMLTQTLNPGNIKTTYKYHANGKIDTVTYPGKRVLHYVYDTIGRMTDRSMTGEGNIHYDYDSSGDMFRMTDANGKITTMIYDQAHRVTMTILPSSGQASDERFITKEYDENGRMVRTIDPIGKAFAFTYFDNGRRKELRRDNALGALLGGFGWDANTPTSDGAVSWTLDNAGRVASTSTGVTYEYNHPMGMMTRKTYAGADLSYAYNVSNYLTSVSDQLGNRLTFDIYTNDGRPQSAHYSNGIQVNWGYSNDRYVSSMSHTKSGTTLYSFNATLDNAGRRQNLSVSTGENFVYAYDPATQQLVTEQRTQPGAPNTTTRFAYDPVGNRTSKTVNNGTPEVYSYNDRYELNTINHADNTQSNFGYDKNGNLTSRSRAVPVSDLHIGYQNTSGGDVHCTAVINGAALGTVTFGVTAAGQTGDVAISVPVASSVQLVVTQADADFNTNSNTAPARTATVTWLSVIRGTESQLFTGSTAIGIGVAVAGTTATGFGEAGDSLSWTVPPPGTDYGDYIYAWDDLNRLTSTTRALNGNQVANSSMTYAAAMGWQLASVTTNGASRGFSWGLGGELLSENYPGLGNRTYVNSGVDHVLWMLGSDQPHFYLNDVNGSVYALTDGAGSVIERQNFDAYGKTNITSPANTPRTASTLGNTLGFQGRSNVAEIGLHYFRNRWYDQSTGRFLSRDPLGLIDGPALYGFCGGDPVNNVDPMGLRWHWVTFPPPPHWQWRDDGDGPTPQKLAEGYDITGLGEEITDTYTTPYGEIVAVKDKCEYDAIIAGHNQAIINFRRNIGRIAIEDKEHAERLANDLSLASNFFREFAKGVEKQWNNPVNQASRFINELAMTEAGGVAIEGFIGIMQAGRGLSAAEKARYVRLFEEGQEAKRAEELAQGNIARESQVLRRQAAKEAEYLRARLSVQNLGKSPSSEVLGKNLEAVGKTRPSNSAAHHIVAGGDSRAAQAQAILKREGIDINEATNGVFLPKNKAFASPPAMTHSTIHTDRYYQAITGELQQAAPGTVRDLLEDIAQRILNGTFPR